MRIENIEKRYKIVFVFFSPVLCTSSYGRFCLSSHRLQQNRSYLKHSILWQVFCLFLEFCFIIRVKNELNWHAQMQHTVDHCIYRSSLYWNGHILWKRSHLTDRLHFCSAGILKGTVSRVSYPLPHFFH